MPIRSLVSLRGIIEGIPNGSVNIKPTDIQNNTPPNFALQASLVNGNNIFPIPPTARGCVVTFDPTSTTAKRLKGISGDTGIGIYARDWIVLTFATGTNEFIISLSANDTGKTTTVTYF